MTTFENTNPIIDKDGIVWDLYWLTTMVISTDLESNKPSLYTEFYPCRQVDGRKIIKTDLQGEEVKSIKVDNLFGEAESNPQIDQVMDTILEVLKVIGQSNGLFK